MPVVQIRETIAISQEKKTPETVDLTPTWAALMPLFINILQEGTAEGKESVSKELTRLAKIADDLKAERKDLVDALKACLAIVNRCQATDADAVRAHVKARAILVLVEGVTRFVTMYHGAPKHDWIFTRYQGSPETLERVAHVLDANGYTVQRDETDGRISAFYNGELVAVVQ